MRQRRPDPPSTLVTVGAVVTALLLSGVAGGLAYETVLGTEDLGLVAVLVGAVAVIVWIGVAGTLAQRRFPRGLPAPRAGTWQDAPAVELPEWSWGARATPLVLGLVTVAGLVLGLGAILAGQVLFGVPALLGGLGGAYLLTRVLLGRQVVRGGAWLTPELVGCQHQGTVAWLAWDDVEEALTAESPGSSLHAGDVMVLARGEGRVSVGQATRGGEPRESGHESYLVIDTRWLGLPPAGLKALLDHYRTAHEARAELGSQEGVRRALGHAHQVVRAQALR